MSSGGHTSTFYLHPAFCSESRQGRNDVYCTSIHGTVYYTPRQSLDRASREAAPATFPIPHIRARQRRPHSIHIVSYPPGYIPTELRPKLSKAKESVDKERKKKRKKEEGERSHKKEAAVTDKPPSKVLEKLFAVLCAKTSAKSSTSETTPRSPLNSRAKPRPVSLFSLASRLSRVPETIYEEDSMTHAPAMMALRPPLATAGIQMSSSNRNSILSTRSVKSIMSASVAEVSNKPVASGNGLSCSIFLAESNVFLTGFDHDGHTRRDASNATALLRGKLQLNVSKNTKIKSVTLKLTGKGRTEWPEGIPPLKVDMFEEESLRTQALTFFHAMHEAWETPYGNQCTYTLKGSSEEPSNTGLNRLSMSLSPAASATSLALNSRNRASTNLTAKELKRLSLQSAQSRSFGKGESPTANQIQAKSYKVFYPGTYEYSFELPIDHHQLETTKLQYGSVKWELETAVERAGAFKPNLHGTKEVSIVRVPDQLSLETTEPISISRQWEDQLHYDIIISGKSFPIGTKIPIAFKLTPLAKVQVHKLKVFVTESIEYWTNDRRVTRKDPGRKILLLEKTAGKPLDKQYESSDIRVLGGGELSPDERDEARAAASRRRTMEAQRTRGIPQPLPEPTENILGDLDLGLEAYWGSTEIEMNVQIPTCERMAKDKAMRLNPDCSWKNVNVFHWIKIVMRISRLDPDDPAGKRRRHFEISIDSPFTVLNCRSTQANTALPQYSAPDSPAGYRQQSSCGCPDAEILATNPSPASSTGTLPMVESDTVSPAMPMPPQAAHLYAAPEVTSGLSRPGSSNTTTSPPSANPLQRVRDQEFHAARPMHLLRVPSYDPPAFDADNAPPPMPADIMTPPPNYDAIIGTPSVDGMADYFARLADYNVPGLAGEEDSDSGEENSPTRTVSRGGRVNVVNPRTPGGRLMPSRSLDIERPMIPLSMADIVRRGE